MDCGCKRLAATGIVLLLMFVVTCLVDVCYYFVGCYAFVWGRVRNSDGVPAARDDGLLRLAPRPPHSEAPKQWSPPWTRLRARREVAMARGKSKDMTPSRMNNYFRGAYPRLPAKLLAPDLGNRTATIRPSAFPGRSWRSRPRPCMLRILPTPSECSPSGSRWSRPSTRPAFAARRSRRRSPASVASRRCTS